MLNETKLENIKQLESLVEIDQNNNKLKEISLLFINAFNDWDTQNQTNIFEFIDELKNYFGTPLTKEKIQNKTNAFSGDNAWKLETANSIIEMLELSELILKQSDFEKIIEKIIRYYKAMLEKIDFIAELKYKTSDEDGRKTPAFSKYRPQIKFPFDDMQTSGEQIFLNKETVNPGDDVKASIRIIAVEYFANRLEEGMTFEFREGPRIIGTGKITEILNEKLKKASR